MRRDSLRPGLRALAIGCAVVLIAMLASRLPSATAAGAGCTTPAAPLAGARNILLAGDSVTSGTVGDYSWRYFLWKQLADRHVPVDFRGRFSDLENYQGLPQDLSHFYAACDFDWDNESRIGQKLADFNAPTAYYPGASSWIAGAVAATSPDVVIAFVGFNDLDRYSEDHPVATPAKMAADTLAEAHELVTNIRAARPSDPPDVILAAVTGPERYAEYADRLLAAAPGWSQGASTVEATVLPSWTAGGHTWDGWHPDGQGDAMIGAAFETALHDLDAYYPVAEDAPTVAVGPAQASVLAPPTTPDDNTVGLAWTMAPGADRTVVMMRDVTADPSAAWAPVEDLVLSAYLPSFPHLGTVHCPKRCLGDQVHGLIAGHQYAFKLETAKGLSVSSLESNVVTATASGVTTPTLTSAVAGAHSATVHWTPVVGAYAYRVYQRMAGTSGWTWVAGTSGTSAVVQHLTAGASYELAVAAVFSGTQIGTLSNVVAAKPVYAVVAAPAKPKLAALSGHRLRATWARRTDATRYLVQVRRGQTVIRAGFVTGTSYSSPRLARRTTYTVRVRPYDGPQAGGYSAAAVIRIK